MKRIAVIGLKGLPAFGGAAAVGENLINELKDRFQFTVYSVSSHTTLETGDYNGVKQVVFRKIPNKKLNILVYYLRSAVAVLFHRFDIVHLHHSDAAFIIPLIRIRHPLVLTTHGTFNITSKWVKWSFYFKLQARLFVRMATIVTCVSKKEKRIFKSDFNIDTVYIPNGVTENNNFSLQKKGQLLFAAGRLIESKGCHVMLDALNDLNFKGRLLVVGDYTQSPEYFAILKQKSMNLDCTFVGLIKDKQHLFEIIGESSLFIYPSRLEAMSMMLLETASIGTPIICSDIEGNLDTFNTDEVLFFQDNSSSDLALKIQFALENATEMNERARRAKERLLKENKWSHIANSYAAIYQNIG